jgi:ABC-type antimicrobial peptide transport system permease subunit
MKLNYNPGPVPVNSPDEDFLNSYYLSYLELYPGSDVHQVEEKLKDIMVREMTPYASLFGFTEIPPMKFPLQMISAQHLYNADGSPGAMVKVRLFAIIATLILVIACINYVNLVTARTRKRTKEMGVRKFLGAKWGNIVWQSLQETCIMLAIAIFLATELIYLLLPLFNHVSGKVLEFRFFDLHVLIIYGITFLCVLVLAGLYPSFYLASFDASKIMNNRNRHAAFRRVLVVLQFVCSIVLIVSTLVITLQMNFIRKKDLGYDKENVICFAAWGFAGRMDVVRNELHQNPDITGTAAASFQNMINNNYFTYGFSWQGRETEKAIKFGIGWVDFDFLQLMNIQLVDGQMPPETSDGIYCLLNETAVREMEVKDPLNLLMYQGNNTITVSGVVRDFHFELLNQTVAPMVMFCTKNYNNNFFYVKTTAQGTQSALASIEKIWKQYCPNLIFSYSFLDENFERLYQTDIRMGWLLYTFAFIAIMISCLGLFGLVTFTAETKTKEIGIRKVLGAKVSDIVSMLSKEYIVLVGIAMLIAFPLAYYWLNRMLQDYAYRIEIKWWMFALAGIVTIVLTLITVGWKAIKAATENPVKAIKSE